MSWYFVFYLFVFNQVEMSLETCFHTVHRLADILFPAGFARDTIYQVVAHAVNILHGCVCLVRGVRCYVA